ncbi:MAG: M67 family metallopeptidase [Planctomycetota bacterium]
MPSPPSTLTLTEADRRRLHAWALAALPGEACGLLIGHAADQHLRVTEVTRARNRADDHHHFELDPGDWLATHDACRLAGTEIVGVWHSHPDGSGLPSPLDAAAAWPGYACVIVPLTATDRAPRAYWPRGAQLGEIRLEHRSAGGARVSSATRSA